MVQLLIHLLAAMMDVGAAEQEQRTAQEYIAEVPVIMVDGPVAICDGGELL